ncbi:peptidoglycan/LPS O-acetylase OafA/YrhL [Phyllobacterium brassicacearum]|nr:peptidoglycan/LPS O-acetylase OafA/YrhL [Phyllobacterium brassicacearum]
MHLSERIYGLDALRGFAALSVLIWHWQHFFFVGGVPSAVPMTNQPFYPILFAFYHFGYYGVEMFFCLSGFVFFWLFSTKITKRAINLSQFAVDRFSRLYPLHFVTFLMVAGLQYFYISNHRVLFVYQANDVYHAVLNLLLMPAWFPEPGWSFNGPIWSVSIEVLMYALFAAACLTGRLKYVIFAGFIIVGFLLPGEWHKVAKGLKLFFVGGFAYLALSALLRLMSAHRTAGLLCGLCLGAWSWIIIYGAGVLFVTCITFPLTVMALAALNAVWPDRFRSLKWLGDSSYAIYLLHVPFQITLAMIADGLGYTREIFQSRAIFLLFFSVLVAASLLCHHYFETWAKNGIRMRYAKAVAAKLRIADRDHFKRHIEDVRPVTATSTNGAVRVD